MRLTSFLYVQSNPLHEHGDRQVLNFARGGSNSIIVFGYTDRGLTLLAVESDLVDILGSLLVRQSYAVAQHRRKADLCR